MSSAVLDSLSHLHIGIAVAVVLLSEQHHVHPNKHTSHHSLPLKCLDAGKQLLCLRLVHVLHISEIHCKLLCVSLVILMHALHSTDSKPVLPPLSRRTSAEGSCCAPRSDNHNTMKGIRMQINNVTNWPTSFACCAISSARAALPLNSSFFATS